MAVQSVPRITEDRGWCKAHERYSSFSTSVTLKGALKMVEALAGLRPITDSSRILDVGAGTGAIEQSLEKVHADTGFSVLAIDKEPGMVRQIRAQNIPNVTAEVGDATALSKAIVPDDGFTHALGSLLVQWCGERQPLVCQELFRALEPGGVAALSVAFGHSFAEPWDRACRQLDPNYVACDTFDTLPKGAWSAADPLIAAMKDAGFVDVASFDVWLAVEAGHDEWISYWMESETGHVIFSQQLQAWKGNREDVRPVFEKVCKEQFPDLSVLGATLAVVVGRKPMYG